jgi:hypothetical protein
MNDDDDDEPEEEAELYRDCVWFHEHCGAKGGDDYVYAPRRPDADLDADLFRAMTAHCRGRGGSDARRTVNVFVPGDDWYKKYDDDDCNVAAYHRAGDSFPEQASVGHVYRESLPKCEECGLVVPADLDYYYYCDVTLEGAKEGESVDIVVVGDDALPPAPPVVERLLCRVCFQKQTVPAARVDRQATGMDNLSDWIELCTVVVEYAATPENFGGGIGRYFYNLFCNLNRASSMHGRIAIQYYVSGGIGEVLRVQPETTTLDSELTMLGACRAGECNGVH